MSFRECAKAHGFAACYALRPDKFNHYERRLLAGALFSGGTGLCVDPAHDYPWANAILACLWPYDPLGPDVPLCSNYIPANSAYHAADRLLPDLLEAGVRAERADLPVRELLIRSGIGVALHNGLTAVPPYGSRFAIQTLVAALPAPFAYDDRAPLGACENCRACVKACPAGAIGEDGFDYHRCLRAYMGKEAMPLWIMDGMQKMLGCERCQYVCPQNDGQRTVEALPPAFAYERLLKSDLHDALALVGFNQKSGGRLIAHAAVMAAHEGRADLLPLIKALLADPREAVRVAAAYAISELHNEENMV